MPYAPELIAAAVAIGTLGGVVRGITGFGGAMVIAPPLALLMGPAIAVSVAVLLEGLAGTHLLVQVRREIRLRTIGPIVLATMAFTPVGAFTLASLDPAFVRRFIAGWVIAFSLVLLLGWRYAGRQRLSTSIAVGAFGGSMMGFTGMGGPPVIVYLLAGPDSIQTTRANMTLFVAGASLGAITSLWAAGVLGMDAVLVSLMLAPGYLVGLALGVRAFSRFDDVRFRRFVLVMMIAVSTGVLLA